jgi:hypothetical protein
VALIASEVTAPGTVESVRGALLKLFANFTIHPAGTIDVPAIVENEDDPFTDVIGTEGYVIVIEPRPEAVEGLDEDWRPVLKRVPLHSLRVNDVKSLTM